MRQDAVSSFTGLDPAATAFLFDVDGTLIDLGPSPFEVDVPDSLRASLSRLLELADGALALVSGRPIRDLDTLFDPLKLPAVGGHGAETARAGGRDAGEGADNADDGAEQSDERCGRSDGRQRADALLQVGRGQRGGALNGAANGVEHVFTIEVGAAGFLLELVFLQACEHDFREVAVAIVLRSRKSDRFLQAAVLQVFGHLRRIELRLLARLVVGVDALDSHTDGPE